MKTMIFLSRRCLAFCCGAFLILSGQLFALDYPGIDYPVGYLGSVANLKSLSTLPPFGADIVYNPTTKRVRILADGAIFDGYDLRGAYITVEANNVTVRNCLADASSGAFHIIDQYNGRTGLSVENCTFDGQKLNNSNAAFVLGRGGFVTVRSNKMINSPSDMIKITSAHIENNHFEDGGYATGAHADAIQSIGGPGPIFITRNYFDWRNINGGTTNSAVIVQSDISTINGVYITNNIALGGSSTFNISEKNGHAMTNVIVNDNQFGDWQFYYLYPANRPAGIIFQGNTNYYTGASLSL